LIVAGWKYASRSWRYHEVSVMSPANVPIFQFKSVIVAAGILLLIQGIAQVCRSIVCLQTGRWPPHKDDVEELEQVLLKQYSEGKAPIGSVEITPPIGGPGSRS
jgi:TRAP-type mannitol/chloroaromatic compound transport system permease small subunit